MYKTKRIMAVLITAVLCITFLSACKKSKDVSSSAQQIASSLAQSSSSLQSSSSAQTSSALVESEAAVSSVSSISSVASLPPQAAPVFVENPVVTSVNGKTVTVQYKTDINATVNAIMTTSADKMKVSTFYDYLRRGVAYAPAVLSQQTHNVGSNGKTASFEIPDLSQNYYLLLNAVEEITDSTWQNSVTVIQIYDASVYAPAFVVAPARVEDEGETMVFTFETQYATNVYMVVTTQEGAAPTAQQIKEGGGAFAGTIISATSAATSVETPFKGKITLAKSSFAAGNYSVWFTVQSAAHGDWQFSEPVKIDFAA